MAENTKIEWCDHTWNPWEGCQKVGPGCDYCYAETRNARFAGGTAINWGPGAPRRRTSIANWRKPHAWNRDAGEFYVLHQRWQRVFCASLADWLDNAVPIEWVMDLLDTIRLTPNLDWLMLSKRIGNWLGRLEQARAHAFSIRHDDLHQWIAAWMDGNPPTNIWIGATIVNQEEADRDIPKLLVVPARVRFLSMEPLLGPVDLMKNIGGTRWMGGQRGCAGTTDGRHVHDDLCGRGIDWVIIGGESGQHARPMHPDWARSLRDQCAVAGVPFLFKQWGEWTPEDWGERAGYKDTAGVLPSGQHLLMSQGYVPPFDSGDRLKAANNVRLDGRTLMDRIGKKLAGRLLDGVTHNEFPKQS